MTHRSLISLGALLLLAPAAHAKEIAKAELCGVDRCVDVTRHVGHRLLEAGTVPPPAAPGRFLEIAYTVRVEARRPPIRFTNQVLVRPGLIRGESGTWIRAGADDRAMLRGASAELEPFPAKRLLRLAPELRPPEGVGPPARAPAVEAGGGPLPLPALAAVAAFALLTLAGARRSRPAPQR